jgi:hypothetical protein
LSLPSSRLSLEAIKTWREHPEQKEVQRLGRELFYSWYEIQVVKVDRQYEWSLGESAGVGIYLQDKEATQ